MKILNSSQIILKCNDESNQSREEVTENFKSSFRLQMICARVCVHVCMCLDMQAFNDSPQHKPLFVIVP